MPFEVDGWDRWHHHSVSTACTVTMTFAFFFFFGDEQGMKLLIQGQPLDWGVINVTQTFLKSIGIC